MWLFCWKSIKGCRTALFADFFSYKPPGFNVIFEPETRHLKKYIPVSKTIASYLEDENHKEVTINGETMAFNLQLKNISDFSEEKGNLDFAWYISEWLSKNIKLIPNALVGDTSLLH